MAKRRTRKDRMVAKLRRELEKAPAVVTETLKVSTVNNASTKPDYYAPEINLPMVSLKYDLTKTATVTILALVFQAGMAWYLNHGGWQILTNGLLKRILPV